MLSIIKTNLTIFLLAIIVRVILMPFFFHPDLKTQYYHGNFLTKGITNIYQYMADNKASLPYKDSFNYPPLSYFFLGTTSLILNPLLGQSHQLWLFNLNEDWFTSPEIFKILFLLKMPYLFFDLFTGVVLASMLDQKHRKKALVIWFFNPVSLYVIYGISNFDIIPTFLTLLAIFFFKEERFLFSGISLGLGVSFKIFPLLYLPFFIFPLLVRKKISVSIKIFLGALIPIVASMIFFVPYLSQVFNSGLTTRVLDIKVPGTPIPIFFVIYGSLLLSSVKGKFDWEKLSFYVCVLTLLMLGISKFHAQWLVWSVPFFIIFAVKNLKLLLLFIPVLFGYILAMLNFQDRFITLGIQSPILPHIYDVGYLEETIFNRLDKTALFWLGRITLLIGLILIVMTIVKDPFKHFKFDLSFKQLFYSFALINIIFFASLIMIGLYYSSDRVLISSQLKNIKTEKIYKDHDYIFKFTPTQDRLKLVYVQLKNPGYLNIDPFVFSIQKDGENLRQINLSGWNLADGDFVKFQFPPIEDIKGKELLIKLKSGTETGGKAIEVITDANNIMAHKIYRKGNFLEESSGNLVNFFNRLTFDKIFLFFYLSLITFLVGLLYRTKQQYEEK